MTYQVISLTANVFYCSVEYGSHYYIRVFGAAISDYGKTLKGFLEVTVPDLEGVFEDLSNITHNVASYIQEIINHPDWFFTSTSPFPCAYVSMDDLVFMSHLEGPDKDGLYNVAVFDKRDSDEALKSDRKSLDVYPYFIFSDFDQSRMGSPQLRDPKLPPRVIIS